ncbi:MAG: ParB N-terminal domain-containing protein [Bacteroidales bacterium]|nr:ParB N-terminal domain-containing protein [Salinivirgaceae bacterium]MBR4214016.1 ParB N-terminal domain-containing protein [Bacteroidales bacterium]
MAKFKTSDTITIKRSQINLNPINPKRHSEASIKLQAKNIRKVGLLGGIVWNRTTGNLVDGHRRVYALDAINGYPDKCEDYDLKVEAVELDADTEKVQLTYMATGNTKYDIDLIADYIKDIDEANFADLGLSDAELNDILSATDTDTKIDDYSDFLAPFAQMDEPEPDTDNSTNSTIPIEQPTKGAADGHIYEAKRQIQERLEEKDDFCNAFVMLSFDNRENKIAFFELLGQKPQRIIKGEEVLRLFD